MMVDTEATIVHTIVDRVTRWPDRAALIFGDDSITYSELLEQVLDAAAWLEEHHIGRGSKVAVLTTNHPMAVVSAPGALYVGATWVPANPRDAASDIAAMLARVDCDALLFGAVTDAVAVIERETPGLRLLAPLDDLSAPRSKAPTLQPRPDDDAAIFFTGGTTGVPKGVVFRHRSLSALAEGYVELCSPDDTISLASAPLTHVAGRQCLASLTGGATTVILPQFDPTGVLDAIERYGVTMIMLTPTMLYMVLAVPDIHARNLSSLRRVSYGAAPVALDRLKEAIDVFGPVLQGGYGQTESPMLISSLLPAEHVSDGGLAEDRRLASVGRSTRFSDVRILGDDDTELPPGEVGEIVVAGDYQMDRYYQDSAATSAVRVGRFQRTGDLGFLDADGFLTIAGRKKDMIITGGFNVYAAEVESALAAHPAVYEVAVFGLPDPMWGESVNAAVQLRIDAAVNVEELRSWARDRLGGVKAPKRIEIIDQIPRSDNGKVLKRALVERYAPGEA